MLFIISAVSFSALNFTKYGRKAMVRKQCTKMENGSEMQEGLKKEDSNDNSALLLAAPVHTNVHNDTNELSPSACASNGKDHALCIKHVDDHVKESDHGNSRDVPVITEPARKSAPMSQLTFVTLLIIVAIVNAMLNGLLPSTQSYTCIPYGRLVYMLALRLSSVAGPIASLLSMLLPKPTTKVVVGLGLLGTTIGIFHLFLASQSPDPILRDQLIGKIIVVSTVLVCLCFFMIYLQLTCKFCRFFL
jgi:riboflavin transporter 2